MMRETRADVLYIMGTARSGSTILGILLSASDGICCAGELSHVFRDGLGSENVCSCGNVSGQCPLWSRVWGLAGWSPSDATESAHVFRSVESHTAFPRLLGWSIRPSVWRRYEHLNRVLFTALADASQDSVILDTSKYASRALAISRLLGKRLKVICLTRSADGIMDAFQKPNHEEQRPKGPFAAAAYYTYVLACIRTVAAILAENILVLSFEDLLQDPDGTLAIIERWSGIDLCLSRQAVRSHADLQVGHLLTANRIRKLDHVRFLSGPAPVKVSSPSRRLLVGMMSGYRRMLGLG